MTRSAGMVNSNGPVEIPTKGNIKTMREMVMEKWHGLMEANTQENGTKAYSMGMERCYFQMEQ